MAFVYDLTDTWNAGGTTFNAIKMNVTDSASAAASKLVTLQVGGAEKFGVDKTGIASFAGAVRGPLGSASAPAFSFTGDTDTGLFFPAANTLALATNGVERFRVDSSGKLGVGTSSPGARLDVAAPGVSARIRITDSDSTAGNGTTFLEFAGNNARAAYLGLSGGAFVFDGESTATHMSFSVGEAERLRIQSNGWVRPGADNTQPLGSASFRWSTVFAGTGTINTSDEREKVWRGAMTEAEMRAAKRLLSELGMFQFTDSIEEKGEDARLHFGVRAQKAFAILEDEGLEWWRYAWCCHDKWDEITEPVMEEVTVEKTYEETEQRDTGEVRVVREAGDRYGIRADQLAYWLIAAQAEIQNDLDARLAKLETAQ